MQGRRKQFWIATVVGLALLGSGAPIASGQGAGVAQPATTLGGKLQSMAARASVIFAGQVVSIARHGSMVEVTFRVDQIVAGTPGATYVLREWAGLWAPGVSRYSVGQRALLFANPASKAGLSSPVDGAEGVVPVMVQGANAPALLDIRRLAASLLRSPSTPLPTEAAAAIQLSDAVAIVHAGSAAAVHEPLRVSVPAQGAPTAPMLPVPATPATTAAAPAAAQPVVATPVRSGVSAGRPIMVPARPGEVAYGTL